MKISFVQTTVADAQYSPPVSGWTEGTMNYTLAKDVPLGESCHLTVLSSKIVVIVQEGPGSLTFVGVFPAQRVIRFQTTGGYSYDFYFHFSEEDEKQWNTLGDMHHLVQGVNSRWLTVNTTRNQ